MNLPVVVTSCLAWSIVAFGIRTMNHYSAQRTAQKMNQYRTWLDDSPTIRRLPYGSYTGGSTMSKHHKMSASRYHATKSVGNRRLLSSDDYNHDTDAMANPSRSLNRLNYAAVEYPIYGGGGTGDYYYPVTNSYDGPSYEDNTTPLNRYEPTMYPPTDNVLEFYDVFTSNIISPSNAFKSVEERQLYKFWQFLINGDAERLASVDDDDDDYDDYEDPQQQPSLESDVISRPYDYHVIQKLIRKQQPAEEQTPSFSPLTPFAGLSQAILRSNVYKLWKSGSPLAKRSTAKNDLKRDMPPLDDDDVHQLDNLKTAYVAVPRVNCEREERTVKMPHRPADEELSSEQIPKSTAQNDQQRYLDKNAAIAYNNVSTFHKLPCSLKSRFTSKAGI